ncbi:hypothetical protein GTGU_04711, partial [Trabulsiella guamensis ATCC 49490]
RQREQTISVAALADQHRLVLICLQQVAQVVQRHQVAAVVLALVVTLIHRWALVTLALLSLPVSLVVLAVAQEDKGLLTHLPMTGLMPMAPEVEAAEPHSVCQL